MCKESTRGPVQGRLKQVEAQLCICREILVVGEQHKNLMVLGPRTAPLHKDWLTLGLGDPLNGFTVHITCTIALLPASVTKSELATSPVLLGFPLQRCINLLKGIFSPYVNELCTAEMPNL